LPGQIALESGRDAEAASLIQWIGANEVLGWSWLFPPYYWHFSARVVEPGRPFSFTAPACANSVMTIRLSAMI